MAGSRKHGVFCLEGAWESNLKSRKSVLPTLDMIERLRFGEYIHRDIGTREELAFYLTKWTQFGYQSYDVLYLAFHGHEGAINLGRQTISLEELAEMVGRKASGRIVYFGSCSVLCDRKGIVNFQKTTGAKVVCGFTEDVDWVESAAFDLLLLTELMRSTRIDAKLRFIRTRYSGLVKHLGFRSYPDYRRTKKAGAQR